MLATDLIISLFGDKSQLLIAPRPVPAENKLHGVVIQRQYPPCVCDRRRAKIRIKSTSTNQPKTWCQEKGRQLTLLRFLQNDFALLEYCHCKL